MTPAIESFAARISPSLTFAQIVIRKSGGGYELRALADQTRSPDSLESLPLRDVRTISQFTATGAFRPLKSAPDLRSGWIMHARDLDELEFALNQIYPGAVADWHAQTRRSDSPAGYREFTNRQTGMYRIVQSLSDEQGAEAAHACCNSTRCLKYRLWTVETLAPDSGEGKSIIPCFEPCAIFLEFVRKIARAELDKKEAIKRQDTPS